MRKLDLPLGDEDEELECQYEYPHGEDQLLSHKQQQNLCHNTNQSDFYRSLDQLNKFCVFLLTELRLDRDSSLSRFGIDPLTCPTIFEILRQAYFDYKYVRLGNELRQSFSIRKVNLHLYALCFTLLQDKV